MRTLALILLSSLLCCCYAQGSVFNPPKGQRCRGRNYDGKRCCTPEQPCGLGEGDCDGPLDGGTHDGHQGCKGDLVCGSNNCRKFGAYFHEKDDCCDRPENLPVRGAGAVTTTGRDAVLQSSLVTRERETVTDL